MGWREFLLGNSTDLYLDGSSSWRVQSNRQQATVLSRIPLKTELALEVIPQRRDASLVFLRLGQSRLANFYPGRYARSLHQAVLAARNAGYRVLARAQRIEPRRASDEYDPRPDPADSYLEVRSVSAADLFYWLAHPSPQRSHGYFELDWMRTSSEPRREDHFQLLREAILGVNRSLIVGCLFSPRQRRSGKPTAVDIIMASWHIGVLRSSGPGMARSGP